MIDWFGRKAKAELEKKRQINAELLGEIVRLRTQIKDDIGIIKRQVTITNIAVSRLIAKIDPQFARDEMSEERKNESNEIGNQVIKRLLAEHRASNPTKDI